MPCRRDANHCIGLTRDIAVGLPGLTTSKFNMWEVLDAFTCSTLQACLKVKVGHGTFCTFRIGQFQVFRVEYYRCRTLVDFSYAKE